MEKVIKKWRVAIDSMTLEEKLEPTIIRGSRLSRISRGSGVEERIIKDLIKQYKTMKKLMKDRKHRRMMKEMFRTTHGI